MYIYSKGGKISKEIIFYLSPIFKQWQNCPDLSHLNFGTLSKFVFDLILKEKKPLKVGYEGTKIQITFQNEIKIRAQLVSNFG